MTALIHDGDGTPYLVSERVKEFCTWHSVPESDLVDLVRTLLWHDVHTDAVEALAVSEMQGEMTTKEREAHWLLHAVAREVKAS